jgi:hypothetical protein
MGYDRTQSVRGLLASAVDALHLVMRDEDVLRHASTAIRLVLLACDDDQRPQFTEDEVAFLVDLIERAAPKISSATGFVLEDERTYIGLGALYGLARELLLRPGISRATADDLTQTRFDHAALLSDELDAIYRRRQIERRGDILRRLIIYSRFEHAGRFGQSLQ